MAGCVFKAVAPIHCVENESAAPELISPLIFRTRRACDAGKMAAVFHPCITMPSTNAIDHYALLTAMLAPAFFLTATASLILSANNRLARVVDRLRALMREIEEPQHEEDLAVLEHNITIQRRRSMRILRAGRLLYWAISCFVATSLTVAVDAFLDYRLGMLPTMFAAAGVLGLFGASVLLSQESHLAVTAVNEEMDQAHARARRKRMVVTPEE